MNDERIVDVVCVVLVDDAGNVFVARRPPDKSLGGLWEFPGGKVDTGEMMEDALRRELMEELQMQVGSLQAMVPVVHTYSFGRIRLWPMLARCLREGRPAYQLHEHTEARWVALGGLREMDLAPADVPVLTQLLKSQGHIN